LDSGAVEGRDIPKVLVLLSPCTSLVDVVREMSLFGYLSPFLWYRFPTIENIGKRQDTCIIAAHAHRDTVIPFEHSLRLKEAYHGRALFRLLESERAGHNDILGSTQSQIPAAISECLTK